MRKLFLILMTLIACTWSLAAQTRTYHGTVLDASNNEPLIGATVMPIGGGQGAAADIDGNFTLTVPANVKKATFSYVGYDSKTVDLRDGMTVSLAPGDVTLDNVVVVAYGTSTKEGLTGSVAVVGSQEIEDRPVTSVTSALEGNAPGVQVSNTVGAPGTAPNITIRGYNSITGSSNPLYVVDGVPFSGTIADLNPADIESMSVLKDAASSALYGNRGANGVILITTKRAKKVGKIDVSLQVRQGMYNRGLPFYDRMNAQEWMQAYFDGYLNPMINTGLSREDAVAQLAPDFISAYPKLNIFGTIDAEGNPVLTPSSELYDANGIFHGEILPGYKGDLDWWKPVSRSGHRQEYNINAAAAGELYNVFASVGYLKENGYMLSTDFERFNARINANFNPVKYFKFGINLSATQQEASDNATQDTDSSENPFRVMLMAPIYPYYAHDALGNVIYEDGEPVWNTASYLGNNNVAVSLREDKSNNSATVIDGIIYGTAVIPYGFELTFRGQMHRDKTMSSSYMNNIIGSAAGLGILSDRYVNVKSHTFQQLLEWNHDYGMHHVDALLDHENYEIYQSSALVQVYDQLVPGMLYLGNFSQNQAPTETIGRLRSESYLARGRYNYDQRYFGELSIRRDGSSRFGKDNRWGTFWSIGGSWIINREKWMERATWVDYLKLRAAYGSVGNDATAGNYTYMSVYNTIPMGNTTGLLPVSIAADDIRWEATKTFDVGIEFNLWRKLYGSIGWFYKVNSDLLYSVTKPASAGTLWATGSLPTVVANVGSMSNRGWEISLKYTIKDTPDFFWDVSVDATMVKNKIRRLPNGRDIPGQSLFIGESLGAIYTTPWAGIDELTGRSLYTIYPNSPDYLAYKEDGSIDQQAMKATYESRIAQAKANKSYVEIDGQAYTTDPSLAGRMIVGNSMPDVYGSVGTNLKWKGVQLGLLFTYSLGGKCYDSNYANLMTISPNSATAFHKDLLKAWTQAPEGLTEHRIDPKGIPAINVDNTLEDNSQSSRFLISRNYIALKNINLSYDLPRKWTNAMLLQKINLGVSIDNLFLISRRKGMNPGYGGNNNMSYVPARVFSFQISAQF